MTPEPTPPPADSSPKAKSRLEQDREDRRQRRVDRYNEVVGLSPPRNESASHQSARCICSERRSGVSCAPASSRNGRHRIEDRRASINSRSFSFVDGARAATMRPNSGTRSKTKAIPADEARWLNSLPPFVFRAPRISARRWLRVRKRPNRLLPGRPRCYWRAGQKS